MAAFLAQIFENGNLIDIISCVFTVMALVFTLYFWLLDHLSEDENKFLEGKSATRETLRSCLEAIREPCGPEELQGAVETVNRELEIVMNYRFWARSRQRPEYEKINEFYQDSRYLLSSLRRYADSRRDPREAGSLVSVPSLDAAELEDIRSDYHAGLTYILEFVENWS